MDLNSITEQIQRMDIAQLIAIGGMFLYLRSSINVKLEKAKGKIDKINNRIDKLAEKITQLEKGQIRIETVLHMQECWMLKTHKEEKKAQ